MTIHGMQCMHRVPRVMHFSALIGIACVYQPSVDIVCFYGLPIVHLEGP